MINKPERLPALVQRKPCRTWILANDDNWETSSDNKWGAVDEFRPVGKVEVQYMGVRELKGRNVNVWSFTVKGRNTCYAAQLVAG